MYGETFGSSESLSGKSKQQQQQLLNPNHVDMHTCASAYTLPHT